MRKKLLLIIAAVTIFFINQDLIQKANAQSYVTPTFHCLGSCPTEITNLAVSSKTTTLGLTVILRGIGRDIVPLHRQRNVTVEVYNAQNLLVANEQGVIVYDISSGKFTGNIKINAPLKTGPYTVKVKTDQYLKALIPGIQTIIAEKFNKLPDVTLILGDINGDNVRNILDYNILMKCYSDLQQATNCSAEEKRMADINDDGNVNQYDYNLFLRELINVGGDSTTPTPTKKPTPTPVKTVMCGQKSAPPSNPGTWACTGTRSTVIAPNGYYSLTHFGCNTGFPKDPNDNCVPACGSIPECVGKSGEACENAIKWYAANADQYGCNAKLKVTNPTTGKAVIVRAIDKGPHCSVQTAGPKFDVSQATNQALGAPGKVKVERVPESTPLGPLPVCSAASPTPTRKPTPTPTKAPTTMTLGMKAVELARKQIGKKYVFGAPTRNWSTLDPNKGKTPSTFDCSGLTGWAWYWATAGKVSMIGQTKSDWNSGRYKKFGPQDKAKLQPGDLLYWETSSIHHTGIYSGKCQKSTGSDCFIEAQQTGVPLLESHLSNRLKGWAGFLRPI